MHTQQNTSLPLQRLLRETLYTQMLRHLHAYRRDVSVPEVSARGFTLVKSRHPRLAHRWMQHRM